MSETSLLYEIINPSDHATFAAPNRMIAALVVCVLGGGAYGGRAEIDDEANGVPIFLLGGFDEWWEKTFPDEELEGITARHRVALAKSLRTVTYASFADRHLFDSAMAAIDDHAKREAFIEEWNDRKRTSMTNIMGRAHELAQRLEAKNNG